jgi:hypothetical protein
MARWVDVETQAPTLATLRRDGSPRISGIELQHAEGDLWLGMMGGSVKGHDLRRDPRFALHSGSEDPPGWRGDAKVAGRAVEVLDAAVVERVVGPEHAGGGAELFRLDVGELVVVRLGEPADHLVIESWHEGRGTHLLQRR